MKRQRNQKPQLHEQSSDSVEFAFEVPGQAHSRLRQSQEARRAGELEILIRKRTYSASRFQACIAFLTLKAGSIREQHEQY